MHKGLTLIPNFNSFVIKFGFCKNLQWWDMKCSMNLVLWSAAKQRDQATWPVLPQAVITILINNSPETSWKIFHVKFYIQLWPWRTFGYPPLLRLSDKKPTSRWTGDQTTPMTTTRRHRETRMWWERHVIRKRYGSYPAIASYLSKLENVRHWHWMQ